jgi:glycosyltransferase involved in cell wall biosynthesis
MVAPIRVALDRNDSPWTTQRTYLDNLAAELASAPEIELVSITDSPDVVHLNYLNPLGRLIHGKESLKRHFRDIFSVVTGSDAALVLTEHGVEEFSDLRHSMYLDRYELVGKTADRAKRQLSRLFGSRADRIIAISSMDREFLVESGFAREVVCHVPHGVDKSFFTSNEADEGFVIHVSKCSPHKNPEAVLETARRIDRPMVIVGGGWKDQYGSELSKIDSVDVKGFVEDSELKRLYAAASVFYFPSTYEPFGLPILEAMASRTPVVASVNSTARDFDSDGVQVVPPDDIDCHVELLEALFTDPEDRERRAAAARSFAREMTWERTAEQTIDIYKDLK